MCPVTPPSCKLWCRSCMLGWAMTDTADFALKRFSTSDLPERDRFPFWRDFFAGQIVHCDVEVTSDIERFHAEAELLVWPELRVLWSKEAPMHYSRSRSQAADGDDLLIFLLRQGGSSALSQRGNDVALAVGEAVGFLGAEPASATVSEIECLAFVAPRAALTPMVGDVAGKAMRLIPRTARRFGSHGLLLYLAGKSCPDDSRGAPFGGDAYP